MSQEDSALSLRSIGKRLGAGKSTLLNLMVAINCRHALFLKDEYFIAKIRGTFNRQEFYGSMG